jgi:hypothetical protein
MATVEKRIEVGVPVETAYNQWTQFEEFPQFMEGVKEVRQIQPDRLFWAAEIAGQRKEWFAQITRQVPDEVIAWRSEGGTTNSGVVTFRQTQPDTTEVQLLIEYEPSDFKEQIGDVLGLVSNRVEGDLNRFKEFIESRGRETGAWRGEIPGGAPGGDRYGASGQGGSGYGGTREGGIGYGTTEGGRAGYGDSGGSGTGAGERSGFGGLGGEGRGTEASGGRMSETGPAFGSMGEGGFREPRPPTGGSDPNFPDRRP